MADLDWDDSTSEADFDNGKKQRRSAAGRKLMRWNPDIDQYVLLAVDIVCTEVGAAVPWGLVAEKVNQNLTGEGIKQHLAKVRKYREQNGRPVPHRSSKGGSRKVAAYGTGANTPQRTLKKKSDDDGHLTGKGAGLLWTNPNQKTSKQQRQPKQETDEPKEQKPNEAKKKAAGDDKSFSTPNTPAKNSRKSIVKADEEDNITSKKSTGKRGRAKKDPIIKEEGNDEYFENYSPTKKQRSSRRKHQVNYNENQLANDEFGEDIFDARPADDGDEAYHDGYSGSQPNTASTAEGASARFSQRDLNAPLGPPPSFDDMLHSRTGMHLYGAAFAHEHQDPNFSGLSTSMNNSYGTCGFGDGQTMYMNSGDMVMDYGFQFNGHPRLTADEMRTHTQSEGYGNSCNNEHSYGYYGGPTPPRKARKQTSRHEADERTLTLSGKKNTKDHEIAKQVKKEKLSRKHRKDSAHSSNNSGEQQTNEFFTHDAFGNIPIANDTGRGLGHGYVHGLPDFSLPLTAYDPQHATTLTTSPTDMMGGDLKNLPFGTNGNGDGSTGITPHFNNFSFGDGGDYAMHSTEFGDHMGFDGGEYGMSGMATANGSLSSSSDTSNACLQSDQKLPGMQYGPGAGLGLENVGDSGMGMDMSGGVEQDHDLFSFVDSEVYH